MIYLTKLSQKEKVKVKHNEIRNGRILPKKNYLDQGKTGVHMQGNFLIETRQLSLSQVGY